MIQYSIILGVLIFLLPAQLPAGEENEKFLCKVTKVTDGDTFVCDYKTRVRLWKYDAEELRDKDKHKKAAAYHAKADMIEKILYENLTCYKKGMSGKRIVAQCFLNDVDIVGIDEKRALSLPQKHK